MMEKLTGVIKAHKNKKPLIMVGVPCHDMVVASFAQSLADMVSNMSRQGYNILVRFYEGTLVHTARQKLVEMALSQNVDYLFFMDSDMVVHPQTISLLLEHKVDVVSPMFFKRTHPYQPCFYSEVSYDTEGKLQLYTPKEWTNNGLHECQATGLAATLIHRRVLEALKNTEMFVSPLPDLGEDIAFCLKAREAGFKVYVDTRFNAGHISKVVVTETSYKEANK